MMIGFVQQSRMHVRFIDKTLKTVKSTNGVRSSTLTGNCEVNTPELSVKRPFESDDEVSSFFTHQGQRLPMILDKLVQIPRWTNDQQNIYQHGNEWERETGRSIVVVGIQAKWFALLFVRRDTIYFSHDAHKIKDGSRRQTFDHVWNSQQLISTTSKSNRSSTDTSQQNSSSNAFCRVTRQHEQGQTYVVGAAISDSWELLQHRSFASDLAK